jgi:hypothetical protein
MSTTCALVLALLTAPPDAPAPIVEPADWPVFRAALFSRAVEWEILDQREDRLLRLEDFQSDLAVLRQRYCDLRDAPPIRDANRFPNRHQITEMLRFNREYRRNLDCRQVFDRDRLGYLKNAVREADELHDLWELVREASSEVYYVPVRRQALKKLRDQLGEAAYHAGDLPPHVPLWRFVDVK